MNKTACFLLVLFLFVLASAAVSVHGSEEQDRTICRVSPPHNVAGLNRFVAAESPAATLRGGGHATLGEQLPQTQPVGIGVYKDLDSLPYLWRNVESHYISSYDRKGGNDDGFRGTYSQLYVDERGEYVIFDAEGPGCVYNFWFTGSNRELHWGKLRMYFDGETKPRFHGTGHEDEYQGGWSTFWLTNPYSLPLFGEPKSENLVNVFGQVNGSTTAYRFWPGGIPFHKSIQISTEHGNHNDTPVNYSSLVYYYYK